RRASERARAARRQGRRRAAEHRAARGRGQRDRGGDWRAGHEPTDHRREDRARARGRRRRRARVMPLTTGVLLLPTYPADRLVELARRAERLGYDYLWLADERFFREVYASLTLCALRTERLKLGPCVTDPYSRHPALTAMAIATLDEISRHRAVLAIGA